MKHKAHGEVAIGTTVHEPGEQMSAWNGLCGTLALPTCQVDCLALRVLVCQAGVT